LSVEQKAMRDTNRFSAKFDDLLLTVFQHGTTWRVCVEEVGEPDSSLSGGMDYSSIERAKQGAVSIALELFGTGVPAEQLDWQPSGDPSSGSIPNDAGAPAAD
jgi:hypothetical protein